MDISIATRVLLVIVGLSTLVWTILLIRNIDFSSWLEVPELVNKILEFVLISWQVCIVAYAIYRVIVL